LSLVDQRGNLTEFRVHPRGRHHRFPGATRYRRALEQHVGPVGQGGIGIERIGLLEHRQRFACQDRLIDLEFRGLQNPHIGADEIAALNQNDVAGDQFLGPHLDDLPGSADAGGDPLESPQRLHRAHGLQFHEQADAHVDHDDPTDRQGIDPITERQRQNRCARQQEHDEALELMDQDLPDALAFDLPQKVWAILLAKSPHLVRVKSTFGTAAKVFYNVFIAQ